MKLRRKRLDAPLVDEERIEERKDVQGDQASDPLVMRSSAKAMAGRVVFTLIGCAGIVIGGLMKWFRPQNLHGSSISYRAFASPSVISRTDRNFWTSLAFVMILVAAVGILGLAMSSGWITRIAGVFGLVGVGLFLISLHRAKEAVFQAAGPGLWIVLAASVIELIAGLFSIRPMVVRRSMIHA